MFFKKIYYENHCDYLLIAHHLDDFIETAQMQLQSQRNQFYYGIKKLTKFMICQFIDLFYSNILKVLY
ncbi:hypothetical protein NW731_02845 [Mycoplasmopsis felis]|nr:ATP-binding protein [Mycoplasmopsis felis]MCU9937406.1 hypothetical protein [Mycoplasmopsis felis]